MKLKINWSDSAKQSFKAIVSQIESRWTQKEASAFVKDAFNTLDVISTNPYIFPVTEYADVRRAVIAKQTSVFYKVNGDRIEILFFWDNRQEPLIGNEHL